jgi:hypothetical protein
MQSTRTIPLLGLLAGMICAGCGSDQLAFRAEKPKPAATHLVAYVLLGCDLEDEAGVSDVDVDYRSDQVVVTFSGTYADREEDCLDEERREVELKEPLGDRSLCDGSVDPPAHVDATETDDRRRC